MNTVRTRLRLRRHVLSPRYLLHTARYLNLRCSSGKTGLVTNLYTFVMPREIGVTHEGVFVRITSTPISTEDNDPSKWPHGQTRSPSTTTSSLATTGGVGAFIILSLQLTMRMSSTCSLSTKHFHLW